MKQVANQQAPRVKSAQALLKLQKAKKKEKSTKTVRSIQAGSVSVNESYMNKPASDQAYDR